MGFAHRLLSDAVPILASFPVVQVRLSNSNFLLNTEMQENMWAKLRESHACAGARITQPSPHILQHICTTYLLSGKLPTLPWLCCVGTSGDGGEKIAMASRRSRSRGIGLPPGSKSDQTNPQPDFGRGGRCGRGAIRSIQVQYKPVKVKSKKIEVISGFT